MVILSDYADRERVVLSFTGEIDLANATAMVTAVDAAIQDGAQSVVINLSRVTFFGSSGIHCLIDARDHLTAVGASLTISDMSPPVRRIMAAAGMLEPFDLVL